MTFQPSPQQSDIFSAIARADENLIVEAVAGSGKTTTIVEGTKHIPRGTALLAPSIVFLAFNKSIADTLQTRLPRGVQSSTFHSLGFRALKNSSIVDRNVKVDARKCAKLVWNAMGETEDTRAVIQLVSLAKSRTAPQGMMETSFWQDIVKHHDLIVDDSSRAYAVAQKVLEKSNEMLDVVDFDDMLYLPVLHNAHFDQQDWIFVDEAQDTNDIQLEILLRLMGSKERPVTVDWKGVTLGPSTTRLCAVGDPHQCHPTGTLIDTPQGKKPIQLLTTSDHVIGYHRDIKHFRDRKVLAVASRQFCGELLVITTADCQLKVTPNHRCFVRILAPPTDFALYVMRKGNKVRLGITQVHQSGRNGFGPGLRGRQERADAVWVLSIHKTRDDALIHEKAIGARFGISDMCFMNSGEVATSQEVLDAAWSIVGDSTDRLESVLSAYGRDINYPIWSKEDNTHVGFKSFITAACNLLPEVMEVARRNEQELEWERFVLLKFPYVGDVWSLSVEADPTTGRRLYVADDLVTHNSIYGFRGANADSMERIASRFSCKTYPLSVSYRCSKAVVKEAQRYLCQNL